MCRLIALSLATTVLLARPVFAGPFGIDEGQKIDQLDAQPNPENHLFTELKSVPRPHPLFKRYFVLATPEAGVCAIKAISEPITHDAYGTQVRDQFATTRKQLEATYGKNKMIDTLAPGSIWNEPREWTMALLQNQRFYLGYWNKDTGAKLKDGISEIALEIDAFASDGSFMVLQYKLDNNAACDAEREAAQKGSL